MKILYVDLEFDYGDKSRGRNIIGQDGFIYSFQALGHEVIPFYYDRFLKDINTLQTQLITYADSIKPDLIFFSLFRNQFHHKTLSFLKKKYTTINWFGDDQWRFKSFTKYYLNDFSWCVTTDKFSVNEYKKLGQENIILSQWAAIDSHKINSSDSIYKYDVSFVGGYHPYRAWFINQLTRKGINISVFGHGWSNGPLTPNEMLKVFNESKINLNISNSSSLDIRYLVSSIKGFAMSFKSKKDKNQIKARNFEIPYFGGFQLSDYVIGLEDYFHIGKEISCYANPDDALVQIKYFLGHDEEREKIRQNGYIRAKKDHGYINRLQEVLEIVE